MPDVFEKRVLRAERLATTWDFASGLLDLFADVYRFQKAIFHELDRTAHPPVCVTDAFQHLPTLLGIVAIKAPSSLREHVPRLKELGPEFWERFSLTFHRREWFDEPARPEDFFVRVAEEPVHLLRRGIAPSGATQQRCPACAAPPGVSLLREDKAAETVRRSLICALCSSEWEFPRVLCPACKEERPEKLPRYTAQEIPWMRVEACDSCKKYIKSVDLTLNWEAEPIVDELASTPLDVIAQEHGYTKIAPNLAGI